MRRLLKLVAIPAVVLMAGALGMPAAMAKPPTPPGHPGCPGVVSQPDVSPPAGYTQVVNAVMKVTNDEDSGFFGYWALDNYTKHIQAWEDSTGTNFYVAAIYNGTWHTFAGALSPENGVTEPRDGTGSIGGGYIGTLTGSMLNSPTEPTHGTVGAYDLGGSGSDILLGSYANGQTGDPRTVDWLTFYFTPSTITTFNFASSGNEWGWRYTGNTTSGPWCNTGVGSSGDIVTH